MFNKKFDFHKQEELHGAENTEYCGIDFSNGGKKEKSFFLAQKLKLHLAKLSYVRLHWGQLAAGFLALVVVVVSGFLIFRTKPEARFTSAAGRVETAKLQQFSTIPNLQLQSAVPPKTSAAKSLKKPKTVKQTKITTAAEPTQTTVKKAEKIAIVKKTAAAPKKLYVNADSVNIRKKPDIGAAVVGEARINEEFTGKKEKNGFVEVEGNGKSGFIKKELLDKTPVAAPMPDKDYYVQVNQAYIREKGNLDAAIVGFALMGMKITVTEPGEAWSGIVTDGGLSGYMLNELFGEKKPEAQLDNLEINAPSWISVDVAILREKAGTDSQVLMALTKNEKVKVLSSDGSWAHVKTSGGLEGYIRGDLLTDEKPKSPYTNTGRTLYVGADIVNVRKQDNENAELLGQLAPETAITEIKTDGEWSMIEYDGQEAYILSSLLTDVDPGHGSESGNNEANGEVYVSASAANIRASGNTGSAIVEICFYGDKLETFYNDGEWTKVKTANGNVGYIRNDLYSSEPVNPDKDGNGDNGAGTGDGAGNGDADDNKGGDDGKAGGENGVITGGTVLGNHVAEIAMSCLGVPYVFGGASRSGFDCSGLVKYCYNQAGYGMGVHGATSQSYLGTTVDQQHLQPGDMLFFNGGYEEGTFYYQHVGIYVGNGQMVHAPQPGEVVTCVSLSDFWTPVELAKRIID